MGPLRSRSQTARYLRADIPPVAPDDQFVALLADLAGSSAPAADRSRVGKKALLRVELAAATASVALVAMGAAYAADRFGSEVPAPVHDTDTVDPAGPNEPLEPYEDRVRDRAPDDSDEHRGANAHQGAESDPAGSAAPDEEIESSRPEAPTPLRQDLAEQPGSGPKGTDSDGGAPNDSSGDSADPPEDSGADANPDGDADDPDDDRDNDPDDDADAEDDADTGDAERADREDDDG